MLADLLNSLDAALIGGLVGRAQRRSLFTFTTVGSWSSIDNAISFCRAKASESKLTTAPEEEPGTIRRVRTLQMFGISSFPENGFLAALDQIPKN